MLAENREKLGAGYVGAVESAIAECRKAVEGNDPQIINQAVEALTQASHKIAQAMYSQPGGQPGGQADGQTGGQAGDGRGSSTSAEDDVIDAEYVDVDEGKKD
jgi:molecular chaperone DnaK